MQLPESLTAIVHVRFHYAAETRQKGCRGEQRRAELLERILARVSRLDPESYRIFAEFAGQADEVSEDGQGESPD